MFHASAHRIDSRLALEVDVNGRHRILTDEPAAVGGMDRGPAPHELMAAMIAACVEVTMLIYAQRQRWDTDGLAVSVHYDETTTPRRVHTEIEMPHGLSVEQMRRLERVAVACPVKRALEAGFAFETTTHSATIPSAR